MPATDIAEMTPMLPEVQGRIPGDLRDLSVELARATSRLSGMLAPQVRMEIAGLRRSLNCYYSNLIEGHRTRLVDIERALRADYSDNRGQRLLQMEAVAHIRVEEAVDARLDVEPGADVADPAFIGWLHEAFYQGMPAEYAHLIHGGTGERHRVKPGVYRTANVEVGRHVAPEHGRVAAFMDHFHQSYRLDRLHGDHRVIAAAAAHHRLTWIHPFLDGNGRTARLFSYAYLRQVTDGHGLWSISRGLARAREAYMMALSGADARRRNDLDGRGQLSAEGLAAFCRFFIEACIDQADFMYALLQPNTLRQRVLGYAAMRAEGHIPGKARIRRVASHLLAEAVLRGEIPRGEVGRIIGQSDRTARDVTAELLREGLLQSSSPRGPLRLAFPAETAPYYLPRLHSEETMPALEAFSAWAETPGR